MTIAERLERTDDGIAIEVADLATFGSDWRPSVDQVELAEWAGLGGTGSTSTVFAAAVPAVQTGGQFSFPVRGHGP